MFEVNVKNLMKKGRRGPAQVWGSDVCSVELFEDMTSDLACSDVIHVFSEELTPHMTT